MKKQTYYRGSYLIGIYGPIYEGEPLLSLCDNVKEFAEVMQIKESCARMILNKLFHKQTNFIRYFGKNCSVAFINLND